MKPTLKFRWLVLSNPVSRTMIDAYRALYNVSIDEAKQKITTRTKPVLQQFFEYEGFEHEDFECGEWRTIETVVEPHP